MTELRRDLAPSPGLLGTIALDFFGSVVSVTSYGRCKVAKVRIFGRTFEAASEFGYVWRYANGTRVFGPLSLRLISVTTREKGGALFQTARSYGWKPAEQEGSDDGEG